MSDYTNQVLKILGAGGNQLFGTGLVGPTNHTSAVGELNDKLWFYRMRRNANAAASTMYHDIGLAPPFHHLLDPTTVASQYTLVYETIAEANVALGTCRTFWGFCEFLAISGVGTDLLGIGFYADSTDNLLHSFVRHTPTGAAPAVSLHDTASAILQTAPHRLKFIIDGSTKTISFYIDNVLLSSYTPGAAIDRMALTANVNGPKVTFGAFVPANGDVSVRAYAGSIPLVRMKVLSGHGYVAPAGGQTITAYVG